MEYVTIIKKSKRKSLGLEIREAGTLLVRAPLSMSKKEILQEIKKHQAWIDSHMQKIRQKEASQETLPKFSQEEIEEMAADALALIPPKVEKYAAALGVSYGQITIRNQRTRWGSCSAKGNLNFNCLLTQTPESIMDYVVVHELCHRIEMNHSERFWNLVETVLPDYRARRKWLKENGSSLIERM